MEQVVSPQYKAPPELEPLPAHLRADGASASRWSRLWAALIDTALVQLFMAPVHFYAGLYDDFPKLTRPPFPESLLWTLGSLAVWLMLNGHFLANGAQTIGKKLLKIQIVNISDGKPTSFARIALLRALPVYLLAAVPDVGNPIALLDSLFIFRRDRRCLHDYVAGTRVVDARA